MNDIAAAVVQVGARPIIKWAGGKQRLVPELLKRLPDDVHARRHVEPFFGGGALFFGRRPERAFLADANVELMSMYECVRSDLHGVLNELEVLADQHSAETYQRVRELYNHGHVPLASRAAMFIYLNKTGYNGLYRVNKSGKFNVPFGDYRNPRIRDPIGLVRASEILKRAKLAAQDFEQTLDQCEGTDFVYLDPPYMQVSETSFTNYTPGGFTFEGQVKLANWLHVLTGRGVKWLLSQADVPAARDLFSRYRIERVQSPRAINSNPDGRGKVAELLIRNYR